ncbi:MAG: hypothetical protein M3Y77_18290 [Actinomycetota bacterium]|nr:hypothetical protein [Actinomycetota bacterium]
MNTPPRRCRACQQPLPTAQGRRAYCDQACRQAAYRRRHAPPAATIDPALPPPRSRRTGTIYTCPDCDTRYLGQQRCEDCNTFATRLGPGGACPDCDTLITLDELLAAT